ncbi:MAG: sugar phosphate isomerase/epimerase [Candidatus Omnitrophica bacterium]|nr:sugar phosphate isomerase/epimerase [Candidatus Omnitrophota bacterium]
MFALSTVWNSSKYEDGAKIAEEILKLGFSNLELNFSLSAGMVEDIRRFAQSHGIAVTSLHNYCPTPEEFSRQDALPDCFSLSSVDEDERKKAVDYTKGTIATAKKLKSSAVVLHSGRVEIEDKTRILIDLHNKGRSQSSEYKDIFGSFVRERKLKSPGYFSQIIKSFEELSSYAQAQGIILGVENRFYYREIPSFDEFGEVFKRFKNKGLAYWHDVGHAYILEKLGFMPKNALLKNYGKYLYGIHLHNIKNLIDHQAPTEGDFDFLQLKPYIRPGMIKVLEIHGHVSPEDIKKSVIYLDGLFHD